MAHKYTYSASEFQHIKASVFKQIKISTGPSIYSMVNRNQEKLEPFITLKAIQALKLLYPELDVADYKYHEVPKSLRARGYYMASIYTKPEINHPFIVFALADDKYITLVRPFGKSRSQVSINDYAVFTESKFQHEMRRVEYYALFLLFAESAGIRKRELIDSDQYSLLKCINIKQCQQKYKEISARRTGTPEFKIQELKRWKVYYEEKAIKFLQKYFTLLESRDYIEAFLFLKGKNSKYFGRQRLDTFFVDTKGIIGHLEIFVSIYEIMHDIIDRYKALSAGA